jgi:hypothetical protein
MAEQTGRYAGCLTATPSVLRALMLYPRARAANMIAQCRPDAGSDRVGIGIGVDQHAALRVVGGDLPAGVAQA